MDWNLNQLVFVLGLLILGCSLTITNILKKILTTVQWIHVILADIKHIQSIGREKYQIEQEENRKLDQMLPDL